MGAAAGHGSRRLGALRLSLTDRNYRMAQWQRLRRAIARDGLFAVVRRALLTISNTPMATIHDTPLHVTFSAGVATHGGYERFINVQDLLKAADDMLYRSKSLGRNRVNSRAPELVQASA